jgi:hypothetical protein
LEPPTVPDLATSGELLDGAAPFACRMPAPPAAILAVAALLGGAAAGVGLERAGVLSPLDEPEAAAAVRSDVVDVLDCPDGTVVAALTRGDRIVATGRTDDGAWIEIRSPLGLDDRVWLPAATVAPDSARSTLDDLPERECDQVRPSTTTTSTSSTSTTSTTVPETTTTTAAEVPPETTPTTARPRPTTTTTPLPPDTTPPVLGTISRTQVLVNDEGPTCPSNPNLPTTSTVTVNASDDRPGVVVTMTYDFDGRTAHFSGSLTNPTQQGSSFSAVFGPFPDNTAKAGAATNVPITVIARDAAGNQTQGSTFVEFQTCLP